MLQKGDSALAGTLDLDLKQRFCQHLSSSCPRFTPSLDLALNLDLFLNLFIFLSLYRIVLFGLIIGLYLPECPSKYGWDDWFAERDMQVPLNCRPATADEYPWLKIVYSRRKPCFVEIKS